jgi:hypothetical protein
MGIRAAQRERLQRVVSGAVLLPGEGGYADATRTWDLAVGSCPPVALVAASAADIAAGARWAKEDNLDIAVLNTGHGALDHNAGALVINASRVNPTAVDSSARRAIVGPGTCWADVSAASAPLGLTGLAGASPGVGVIGYTLGGGLSPIGRTFGFASDRVVRMTVLDAECRPVRVEAQDGELFWALRGGGGLGIVTELEFGLVELSALFGGGVYFDGEDAESVLRTYRQWVEGLDERTSTSVALIRLPDISQLPDVLRGRFVAHLRIAHVDPHASDLESAGRRILAPMLGSGAKIDDYTTVMGPGQLPDIHRDPVAPQCVAYRGGFVDTLDAPTIAEIAGCVGTGPEDGLRMVELRHLGGAYAHSGVAPSCVTGRDAHFNLYVTTQLTHGNAADARARADGAVERITGSARGQFNFYGPSPEPGSILRLWDFADADRILTVSKNLDPDNRIRTGRPLR